MNLSKQFDGPQELYTDFLNIFFSESLTI
jgi:hypothetical protein